MLILNPLRDTCPCNSGALLKNCCRRRGRLFRPRATTRPPRPRTGFSLSACYASALADCSDEISREHYISEVLLRAIGEDGHVRIRGVPWLKGESREVGIGALTSKMLCTRHNRALSPLDTNATQFFEALNQIRPCHAQYGCGGRDECLLVANGHDIERWLVKVLCGLLYSGNMLVRGASRAGAPLPVEWLEFLFGERAYLPDLGLHVVSAFEEPEAAERHFTVTPLVDAAGEPVGMACQLVQFQLALAPRRLGPGPLTGGVFRPRELIVPTPIGRKLVALSWEHPGDPNGIVLEWHDAAEYAALQAPKLASAAQGSPLEGSST